MPYPYPSRRHSEIIQYSKSSELVFPWTERSNEKKNFFKTAPSLLILSYRFQSIFDRELRKTAADPAKQRHKRGERKLSYICRRTRQNHRTEAEDQGQSNNRRDPRKEMPANRCLPKRIILLRHGESQGNLDTSAYTTTPDYRIPITTLGLEQAQAAGERIRRVVSEDGQSPNSKVYFYVSPYERTRMTLREIGRSFSKKRIIGVREECRIREQDFGNFQVEERMKVIKETRQRFGRFFYRFPEGESAADVFDRISTFMESLWRDIDMNRLNRDNTSDINLIIISHGLTSRVFLTKWFKWTVDQFEHLNNLGNCEFRVMQLGSGGEYSLAIHHTKEEMEQWGLSEEMIADQQWRASANKGDWNNECPWYLDAFFDHLPDSDSDDNDGGDGRA